MERMNAYTRSGEHGTTVIDVEGMAVDLITVWKAGGHTERELIMMITEIWDKVEVSVDIPNANKQ